MTRRALLPGEAGALTKSINRFDWVKDQMRFSDWIKSRLEALHALVTPGDASPAHDAAHPVPDPLHLKISSNPAAVAGVRKSIECFCEVAGLDGPARDEVGLVVNEALANVIRHAYHGDRGKPVEIRAERLPLGVKISVRDWGNGVDPSKTPRGEKDPLEPGGLGLMCIGRLMDGIKYEPQPDGMLLTLIRTTSGSKCTTEDEIEEDGSVPKGDAKVTES